MASNGSTEFLNASLANLQLNEVTVIALMFWNSYNFFVLTSVRVYKAICESRQR